MSYTTFVRASSHTFKKPIQYIAAPSVNSYDFTTSSPAFLAEPIKSFNIEEVLLNEKIGNIGLRSYHKLADHGKQYNLSFNIVPHSLAFLKLVADVFTPGTTIKNINFLLNYAMPDAAGALTDYFVFLKGVLLHTLNFRVSPEPGSQSASFNGYIREVKQAVTAHGLTTPTFKEFTDIVSTPLNHKSGGSNPLLINSNPIPYKDFTMDMNLSAERERLGGDEFDSAYTPLNEVIGGTITLKKGLNQPFLNLLNTANSSSVANTNTIQMKIGGGGTQSITITDASIERASYGNDDMATRTDDVVYNYIGKAVTIA